MLNRREWLRGMSATAALPLASGWLSAEVADWGREVHAAAQSAAPTGLDAALIARLSAVCDRIIPADETPGATAAAVPRFVDHMLTAWYDEPERRRVVAGLQELDGRSRSRVNRPFVDAALAQQDAMLLELDAAGAKSWFATVKYLTIWGYYTSEIGVTQELQQDLAAGRYDGFAPYAPRARRTRQASVATPEDERHHGAE